MLNHKISQKKAFTLIEMLIVIFVLWVGILSIVVLISRNMSLTKDVHMRNTATLLAREGIELIYNYTNTNDLLWYERNCAQKQVPSVRSTSIANNTVFNDSNCGAYFWTGDNGNHRFTIEGINQSQVTLTPLYQWTRTSAHWLQQDPLSARNTTLLSSSQTQWQSSALDNFETLWEASRLYLTGITLNNTLARTAITHDTVWKAIIISWYTHQWGEQTPYARFITFTGINNIPKNSPIHTSDIHHISSTVLYKTASQTGQVVLESFISNPK